MAALSRIANGEHKDLKIMPGDTVVFSSSAIPGNSIMISRVVNLLTRCGADVITNSILNDIHSSGHPAKQELRLLLKLVKPKYFMPMHGEYRMLSLHGDLAHSLGIPKDNIFIMDNGDTLNLNNHNVTRGYPVEAGNTYIDGSDISGLAESVMEDRKILNEEGMIAIAIGINSKTNEIIVPPKVLIKGLINQGDPEIFNDCCFEVEKVLKEALKAKTTFSDLKFIIKQTAANFILSRTKRCPMVIPVIMSKVE
jgi:ribonuclease J